MSRFAYMGRTPQGAPVKGTMEAPSAEAVALRLDQAGVIPISITRERVRIPTTSFPLRTREKRVRGEDLVFFTRQMATLIRAGISLTEALTALHKETQNPTLRATLEAVERRVEGGMSLSEALSHHPRTFSEIYIHTLRAAEAGGFLDQAFARLATMLDNDLDMRRRISAAFRYPAFVLITMAIGVFVLIAFVIPRFAQFYAGFRAALPLPTRLVIGLGKIMSATWPVFVVGVILIVFGLRWMLRQPWGQRTWDAWKLKLPIVGPLTLKLTLSRLGYTLSTMVSTGLALVPALDITSRAVGNMIVGRELRVVQRAVEGGDSLHEPLARSPIFPSLFSEMVSVGERTGALDTLLTAIAEHYEGEVNHTIKNLPSIIEPILLVLVAGMVLVLALAVFLPLWNMVNLIKRG